jgi:hypothetical protein
VDTTLKFIMTKSLGASPLLHRLPLNLSSTHNAGLLPSERRVRSTKPLHSSPVVLRAAAYAKRVWDALRLYVPSRGDAPRLMASVL